jgi:hypothetical protein
MPFFTTLFARQERKTRAVALLIFFLAWLGLGLLIYKDYGISWDETIERTTGIVSVNYIGERFQIDAITKNQTLAKFSHLQLASYPDRVFGPLFGGASVLLERFFHIGEGWNERAIFQFRHLLTFLVVLAGGFALFRLAERRFDDWRIGLLTLTLFVLSPRFFAESFYNNKDLVFLALFLIATNCLVGFILRPNWASTLLFALTSALVIDTRITGIILPVAAATILLLRTLKGEVSWQRTFGFLCLFFCLGGALIVLFWPWLWSAPLAHFLEALQAFSRWTRSDSALYFMGETIRSLQLPWQYVPVWITVTTPPLYLLLFLLGAGLTLIQLARAHWRLWNTLAQLQDLIFLGLFLAPIAAVIALHSVIYDGWRHLYFVYPFLLLIATNGIVFIWQHSQTHAFIRLALTLSVLISLTWSVIWMVQAHPLQNVYFNFLAGKNWKSKFDVDYWGLANRQALEYIARHDERPLIKVFAGSDMDLNIASVILEPATRIRLVTVRSLADADYVLTNYRANPTDYGSGSMPFTPFYEIWIGDEVIESVFKRKAEYGLVPSTYVGEFIDFSKPEISKLFLVGVGAQHFSGNQSGKGWAFPEAWGTWSEGDKAALIFPLPQPESGSKKTVRELKLVVRAFVTANHPQQRVNIWLDGKLQKSVTLLNPANNTITITIPEKPLHPDYITVELEFPDKASPESLGINPDRRQLAIGITGARFD